MRVGTRSLLFGAHALWWHTPLVLIAWWKLFGFPWDPRVWLAILVHDLGYFGCPNMDGEEGEQHPALGGRIMRLFGREWGVFTAAHSRFYARTLGVPPSRLCAADKLSITLEPERFYLTRTRLSGELREYMEGGPARYPEAYPTGALADRREWFDTVVRHNRIWVARFIFRYKSPY